MSEDEFRRLCANPKKADTISPTENIQTHLVKSFLSSQQFDLLQKLTKKLNHNKDKNDLIDCGDFLNLIFTIISESDILDGQLIEKQLIDKLKSVM